MTATFTLTLFALLSVQTPVPATQPSGSAEVEAFVKALDSCTPATAATPHLLMKSFTVQHTIAGPKDAGCDYTQTMPGNMKMVCMLSADGRKALAAEMSVYVKGGSISGSTSAAQPTWTTECQLESPTGQRSPMVTPRNR